MSKINVVKPEIDRNDPFLALLRSMRQESEIRVILKLAGGLIRGYKKFKSIYMTLQSFFPQYFSAMWDGMFFGFWSSELSQNLLSLCYNGCRQALWTHPKEPDPIHHMYFLLEEELNRINLNDIGVKKEEFRELQSEVLAWNFLPTSVAIYWMLLVEIFHAENLPNIFTNGRKKMPEDLRKSFNKLARCFGQMGMKTPDEEHFSENAFEPNEKVGRRIILPFYLSSKERKRVFDFYLKDYDRVNSLEFVDNTKKDEGIGVIEKNAKIIEEMYYYLNLGKIRGSGGDPLDHYRNINTFEDVVCEYFDSYLKEVEVDDEQIGDYKELQEKGFKKNREAIENVDEVVQDLVVKKIKERINIIEEYFALANWRFGLIMKGLKSLARASEENPISFNFVSEDSKRNEESSEYLELLSSKDVTVLCIDFYDGYFRKFRDGEKGYDIGSVNHIHHFFQPVEVCEAVKAGKEIALLKGGPIIVKI